MQTTTGDIRAALEEYKESTETKRKAVEALRLKDEHFVNMIQRQDSRMAKLCVRRKIKGIFMETMGKFI